MKIVFFFLFFNLSVVAATEFSLYREDGSLIEGYLSIPQANSFPLLCAIQGTSLSSVLAWHSDIERSVNSWGCALVTIEKEGISSRDQDFYTYLKTNSLDHRLADYLTLFRELNLAGWNGEVILLGDSEGSIVATTLAKEISVKALILLAAGGGLSPQEEVAWEIRRHLEEWGASQEAISSYLESLSFEFQEAVASPTTDRFLLGNTYKWWADYLTAGFFNNLLNIDTPIYYAHGVEDAKIPCVSAELVSEALKDHNNFTCRFFKGYGHDLKDAFVVKDIELWLKGALPQETSSRNKLEISSPPDFLSPTPNWRLALNSYVIERGESENKINSRTRSRYEKAKEALIDGCAHAASAGLILEACPPLAVYELYKATGSFREAASEYLNAKQTENRELGRVEWWETKRKEREIGFSEEGAKEHEGSYERQRDTEVR